MVFQKTRQGKLENWPEGWLIFQKLLMKKITLIIAEESDKDINLNFFE
jgi:hypothetical protein